VIRGMKDLGQYPKIRSPTRNLQGRWKSAADRTKKRWASSPPVPRAEKTASCHTASAEENERVDRGRGNNEGGIQGGERRAGSYASQPKEDGELLKKK